MDAPPPYSPHDPLTPLTPASSASSESNMTLLPVRPSLRGGYIRPAEEEPEEPSFSSAAPYLQERSFTRPLPSPLIVHDPWVTPLTTREDLRLPDSFDNWLARDISIQDWATFSNYLLAELHVHPDDKSAEYEEPLSPEELHKRQGKVADVIAEWNEGFFGPRGIKISPRYNMVPIARLTDLSPNASAFPAVRSQVHSNYFHNPHMHSHYGVNHHHSGSHHHVTHPWAGQEHAGPAACVSHFVPPPDVHVSGQSGYTSRAKGCAMQGSSHSVPEPHYHHVEFHHGREDERCGRGRGDWRGGRAPGKYRRRDSSTSSSSSSSSDSSISSISSDELEGADVNDIRQSLAAFRLDPMKTRHVRTAVRQLHSELRAQKRESRGEGKERSREAKAEFRTQKRAIKNEVRALLREARTMKRAQKRERKAEKKAIRAERKARKRASKLGRRSGSIRREDTGMFIGPIASSSNAVAQSSGVLSAREVESESWPRGHQENKGIWQSGFGSEKQEKTDEEVRDRLQQQSTQRRRPVKLASGEQLNKLAEARQTEARREEEREVEARERRLEKAAEAREREAEGREAALEKEAEAREAALEKASETREREAEARAARLEKEQEKEARQREQQAELRTRQLEQAARQREQQAELRNRQWEEAAKQREREAENFAAPNVRFAIPVSSLSLSSRQNDEDRRARELEQAAQRMEQEAEKTRREAERLQREAAQRQRRQRQNASGSSHPLIDVSSSSTFPSGPSLSMPGAFPTVAAGGRGGMDWTAHGNTDQQTRGPAEGGEASRMRGLGALGEEFGRNMERWGEQFGRSMEDMGRTLERNLR